MRVFILGIALTLFACGAAEGSGQAAATCQSNADCAAGQMCDGAEGCDAPWTCAPERVCSTDFTEYCSCDGRTVGGSGSCPPERFAHRGPCE